MYGDLPKEEAEKYAAILKPQVWNVHHKTVPFAGYNVVEKLCYLVCEDDKAIPEQWQRGIATQVDQEREKAGKSKVEVTSIGSGHSPYLSRVEETGEWIRRSVGAA
jgi:hypothetical protein